MKNDLDQAFEDQEPQPEPEAPPAEPTGEQETDTVAEQDADGSEKPPEPESDPVEKRLSGLESAIADERRKRQAAEQEAAYIRGKFEAGRERPPQNKPEVDWDKENEQFWANPAQYTRNIAKTLATEHVSSSQQDRDMHRLNASATRVSQTHQDYAEKERVFLTHAKSSTDGGAALFRAILAAPEPAQAMYDMVSEYQQQQARGPDWEQKKEAELRQEIEAKVRKELAGDAVAKAPQTQAGARGTGVTRAPDVDPFDELPTY